MGQLCDAPFMDGDGHDGARQLHQLQVRQLPEDIGLDAIDGDATDHRAPQTLPTAHQTSSTCVASLPVPLLVPDGTSPKISQV
jgi:hypothetical protein